MDLSSVKCFGCQQFGHLERDCPNRNSAAAADSGKPPWCRQCDQRTRMITIRRDGRDVAVRCHCHPAGHLPVQFRRCGECKAVVYEWDGNSECGSHLPVSKPREYIPETERMK